MKVDFSKVVELNHRMLPREEPFNLQTWLYDVNFLGERGEPHSPGTWYVSGDVNFSTHCGTHVEFPLHHVEGGADACSFPLDHLMCECQVIEVPGKIGHPKPGDANIGTMIKIQDAVDIQMIVGGNVKRLEDVKKYDDKIKEGDIIFFHTGFDKNWRTDDWEAFPYLTTEAAKYLVEEKKVFGLGTDATSIEDLNLPDQPNHNLALGHGCCMIESLTNLDKIEGGRALVIMLPLRIPGIEACPCRIIAINDGGIIE